MSISAPQSASRNRWMDWKPKMRISADPPESGPAKPSKPRFVGFDGAPSAECSKIEARTAPAELMRASAILSRAGIRIMALEEGAAIGVWSDLDGPEVRAALRTFGSNGLPVRYLDGAGVPARYKLRRVEGEPVPMNVLAEMEQHPAEPWKVRDRMLNEMGRSPRVSWAEWKAAALNRLVKEQGLAGELGRVTAATVRHGEACERGDKG